MAESLVDLCPTVMWKAEFINDEPGYLAKEISKKSTEGKMCIPLLLIVKCKRKQTEERTKQK